MRTEPRITVGGRRATLHPERALYLERSRTLVVADGLDVPGLGFAVGMERLISLLPEGKGFVKTPHLFIAALGKETQEQAYRLLTQLHLAGIRAELDYEEKSLKSQMRRAGKLKARYALILGDDELKRGQAALRDMEGKTQEDIPLDKLLTILRQKTSCLIRKCYRRDR